MEKESEVFSIEVVDLLIEGVRQKEAIWQKQHKYHSKSLYIERLWMEIAVEICEKKN